MRVLSRNELRQVLSSSAVCPAVAACPAGLPRSRTTPRCAVELQGGVLRRPLLFPIPGGAGARRILPVGLPGGPRGSPGLLREGGMSAFAQARADLAEAMAKLATLDRVFGMMDEYAGLLSAIGQRPELAYDAATGRITLAVVVGGVPPRMAISVEDAVPALAPPVAAKPEQPRRATQFRTGPWTDAELVTAGELIRQGLSNKEIAARLNRSATGIHFKLDPLRAAAQSKIPGEPEGVTTADHPGHTEDGTGGSHGSRLPSGRTDGSGSGSGAAEGLSPAAGESPAPALSAVPASFNMAEARLWWHLDAVADSAWPAARDLDLLERMMRGDGAGGVGEHLGIAKDAVVARWRQLFPERPSIDLQARMVRVLKVRVAAEVAA